MKEEYIGNLQPPGFLTTTQAAKLFGLRDSNLHGWINQRRLHPLIWRSAGSVARNLIDQAELEDLLIRRGRAASQTMPIASIKVDNTIWMRSRVDSETVENYAQMIASGVRFRPIVAYTADDEESTWIGDGVHRLEATRRCGQDSIEAFVFPGARNAALARSLRSNRESTLRRTNADIERAVRTALQLYAPLGVSDRAIARIVGVADVTISRWRNRISETEAQPCRHNAPQSAAVAEKITVKPDIALRLVGLVAPDQYQSLQTACHIFERQTSQSDRLTCAAASARVLLAAYDYLARLTGKRGRGVLHAAREISTLRPLLR